MNGQDRSRGGGDLSPWPDAPGRVGFACAWTLGVVGAMGLCFGISYGSGRAIAGSIGSILVGLAIWMLGDAASSLRRIAGPPPARPGEGRPVRWIVRGADRRTGQDREEMVWADDDELAREAAASIGVVVTDVERAAK